MGLRGRYSGAWLDDQRAGRSMRSLSIGIVLALALAGALYFALRAPRVHRRAEREAVPATRSAPATELAAAPAAEVPAVRAEASPEPRTLVEEAAPEEAEPEVVYELRVRVSDAADRKAVEGAVVTLFDRATPIPRRTDPDGVCSLPLLRPHGRTRLRVEAAGYFDWSQEVSEASISVALTRAVRLVGKVLAADTDEPVSGAELALTLGDCDGCEPARASSDEGGDFELAPVAVRTTATLEVRAPGFATLRRECELRCPGAELRQNVHLERGIALAGRVEDWTSARGLADARVDGVPVAEDGSFAGHVAAHPVTGSASFDVTAPGYATLRVEQSSAEARLDTTFRLPKLAYVEGEVRDVFGEPLAGATVGSWCGGPARAKDGSLIETSPLYELPEGWSLEVARESGRVPIFALADPKTGVGFSDAAGRYRFPHLPWTLGGQLWAHCPGFLDEKRLELPLEPGSVRRVDWRMRPETGLTRVFGHVSLNGQFSDALQGTVSWRGETGSGSMRIEPASVKRFNFEFVVEPGDLRLTAELDLLPELAREVVVRVRPGERRHLFLDVVAPTPSEDAIRGSVRFDDGSPVADADVEARCTLPNLPGSLSFQALTDERGEFELRVVDLGLPYVVVVGLPEPLAAIPDVRPGTRDLDFVLHRQHRLFVRVREGRTGAALVLDRDVQILVRPARLHWRWPIEPVSTLPDVDGWYEFSIVSDTVDLVAVPGESFPLHAASLREGVRLGREPERVELDLAPGAEIVLQLAEGAEPWPSDRRLYLLHERIWDAGVWLYLDPLEAMAGRGAVAFDGEGRVTLRGLPPGLHRFVSLPGDVLVEPELLDVRQGTRAAVTWSWVE